jgi:hypothetical protein
MPDVGSLLLRQQPGAVTPPPPDGDAIKVGPGVTSAQLNAIPAGAVVQFAPGTYHNIHVTPKDRTTWRGVAGDRAKVVLEGDGASNGSNGPAFGGHATDVTLQWLTVQHYWGGGPRTLAAGAAGSGEAAARSWTNGGAGGIRPASGWNEGVPGTNWAIEECEVKENYASGINASNRTRISHCSIHGNASCGIDGFADQVTVENCDIYNNSTWHFSIHIHAGGIKSQAGFSNHQPFHGHIYRRNLIHDNWGDGIWLDFGMFDYLLEGNSIWNNTAHQIRFEACQGMTLYSNQLGLGSADGNGHMDGECLFFQNSGRHLIEKNLIVCTRSIAFKMFQDNRGSSVGVNSFPDIGWFQAGLNTIRGNTFLMINPYAKFAVDSCYAAPAGWNTSDDPTCAYVSSALHKNPGAYAEPSAFCFWPKSITSMRHKIDGNTYRFPAAGQAPNRVSWPAETNAKIIAPGQPNDYVPKDWRILPAWGDGPPPGWAP